MTIIEYKIGNNEPKLAIIPVICDTNNIEEPREQIYEEIDNLVKEKANGDSYSWKYVRQ